MRAIRGTNPARWAHAARRRFCGPGAAAPATYAGLSLTPRATFKYKNELYAEHLALIERYKAEVQAAALEAQELGATRQPQEAPPQHQRSADGAASAAAGAEAPERKAEYADTASQFAEHRKEFEETMRDKEKSRAFRQAVKEYQEQFNHKVEIEVQNGRELADAGLETSGFALLQHTSAVHDWEDLKEVQSKYYPEMRELVRGVTGASRCLVNSHVIRKSGGATPFPPFLEVHSDFTDAYKEALVRSLSTGREQTPTFGIFEQLLEKGVTAEELRGSRVVVVHAWRNVAEAPLRDCPLALCDGRSVGAEELIRERVSGLERYRAMHRPSHRWYWFPEKTKHEVLLFKGFDSECPRYAFHSAFEHPDVPDDVPSRFSCELRILCLIPK
mmetsp:Transcript_126874/g.406266  ORF Transcript_126874/g.406266 Transcript_126874/m.406266 type:complete len:388 (-) Transcript_126874:381-1544(-)